MHVVVMCGCVWVCVGECVGGRGWVGGWGGVWVCMPDVGLVCVGNLSGGILRQLLLVTAPWRC